jgi:hypothetical protein
MECVTTVRYSVRFNNIALDVFTPLCGIRQGDPLSLYLFLFVADVLSRLLQQQVRQQKLHELHICRRAPDISHLLFVDDTLLFMKATKDQATVITKTLRWYEQYTGQLINPSKCSMVFGSLCSVEHHEKVVSILNVPHTVAEEKYLGFPTPDSRMGKGKFKTTKERLVKRFSNWAERHMSAGAKEVPIKLIAQAIPTYAMGIFKLLAGTCEEMTQLIRRFW